MVIVTSTETLWQIYSEILRGYEWGSLQSKVEQTEENRKRWERLSVQIAEIVAQGGIPEFPHEIPDIGDYRPGEI
jgi:hypothetical protein